MQVQPTTLVLPSQNYCEAESEKYQQCINSGSSMLKGYFLYIVYSLYIVWTSQWRRGWRHGVVLINIVALHWARLLLGWVTDCLLTGKPSRYVPNHLGKLSLPSLQGRLSEYQPVWLGLGGAHSLVSGGR